MPQCRTNPLLSGRVRPQAIARSSFKLNSELWTLSLDLLIQHFVTRVPSAWATKVTLPRSGRPLTQRFRQPPHTNSGCQRVSRSQEF